MAPSAPRLAGVKRQSGETWDRVPQIQGSRWGFIGLIAGIFVLLVVSLIICICCIKSKKKKKRMKYAAQGQDLTTTHPEPTYGRKNTTNKPAMRPTAGMSNGGYGNAGDASENDAFMAGSTSADPKYGRRTGGGGYSTPSNLAMAETGSMYGGQHAQGAYGNQAGYGSYGAGYGPYSQDYGAGSQYGYASEYNDAHDGGYGAQQFPEAASQHNVGMAYGADQQSQYGQQRAGYEPSFVSQAGTQQPAPIQQGAYGAYDQRSQYAMQPPSRAASAAPPSHPLPNAPAERPASIQYQPQGASQYDDGMVGGSAAGAQALPASQSSYDQGYGQDATGVDQPPAYGTYEQGGSSAGPSGISASSPQGLPGNFQLPPEKSRGPGA